MMRSIDNATPRVPGSLAGQLPQKQVVRFYWITIIGTAVYVGLNALAQLLPPHYSPIRDPESDLAVGPYGYIMEINFLIRGILSFAFIYAFTKTFRQPGNPNARLRGGAYLLGCWALGAIVLALFPTDVPFMPMSWHGAVHTVVAIIAFAGGAIGSLLLSRQLDQNAPTIRVRRIATILSSLSIVFLMATVLVPSGLGVFGLTERMFLGSVLLWMVVVSIAMVAKQAIRSRLFARNRMITRLGLGRQARSAGQGGHAITPVRDRASNDESPDAKPA